MTFTIVFKTADLTVSDVIEGKAKFSDLAEGLEYGIVEVDAAPATGATLAEIPADANIRRGLKANLSALITSMNSTYGIALLATDDLATASAKLLAAGATYEDCNKIKLIYEAMKEV
jgi:hypothetical protein